MCEHFEGVVNDVKSNSIKEESCKKLLDTNYKKLTYKASLTVHIYPILIN